MTNQGNVIVDQGFDTESLEQAMSDLEAGKEVSLQLYFLETLSPSQLEDLRSDFEQAGVRVESFTQQDDGIVTIRMTPVVTPSSAYAVGYLAYIQLIILGALAVGGLFLGWQMTKQVKETVKAIPWGWIAVGTVGVVGAILLLRRQPTTYVRSRREEED